MQAERSSGGGAAPANSAPDEPRAGSAPLSLRDQLLRLAGLAIIDAVALVFAYSLNANGQLPAGIILLVVTGLINWVFLDDRLYPFRWLTPGLAMMLLLVIYPLIFTLYIGLTNYSDGHLLSKDQVVSLYSQKYYQPPNAVTYKWTAYRNPSGQFMLVLEDPQGELYTGTEGQQIQPLDATTPPDTIGDYQKLSRLDSVKYLGDLQQLQVQSTNGVIRITSLNEAKESLPQYTYDSSADTLTDNQTGVVYKPVDGFFTAPDGTQLTPGFTSFVGFENYVRAFNDPNIQGPFFTVFIWTVVFAAISVLLSFSVGLGLAIVLNDKDLPFKAFFRSITILPYTIPGFISVLVWVGLMNPIYGPFSKLVENIVGTSPQWFSDGTWAKVGILFINTWLGFPYMMLLCLGALQGVPTDMYEAADLDGASPFQQFWKLTLPMLLIAVGPLLIGSFAYNFNNFTVIQLFNAGGPPIPGANTPAGQTDILLSYTYRLAFASGRGADFGLASAITVYIFIIVATITAFNFRYTRQLEEVR